MRKFLINLIVPLAELSLAVFFCAITFNDSATKSIVYSNNLNKEKIISDASLITLERIVNDGTSVILSPVNEEKKSNETKTSEIKEVIVKKDEIKQESIQEPVIPKVEEPKEEIPVLETKQNYNVIETYIGSLTGYGSDCDGCGTMTAADYDISNTIYYDDPEFGRVRIVAAGTVKENDSKKLPFYSIVRISNVSNMDPVIAIVLDRGGSVGYGKVTLFDLLFESESVANKTIGKRKNVTFELLRKGK